MVRLNRINKEKSVSYRHGYERLLGEGLIQYKLMRFSTRLGWAIKCRHKDGSRVPHERLPLLFSQISDYVNGLNGRDVKAVERLTEKCATGNQFTSMKDMDACQSHLAKISKPLNNESQQSEPSASPVAAVSSGFHYPRSEQHSFFAKPQVEKKQDKGSYPRIISGI